MPTDSSVLEAIVTLAEVYRQEMSEGATRAYMAILGDLNQCQVSKMLSTCLASTERFMPPPGILREMAGAGALSQDEAAERAWAELDRALRDDCTQELPERTRRAALQLGTFSELNGLPRRDFDFRRQQFIRLYQADGKQAPAIEHTDQRPLANQVGIPLVLKGVDS